MSATTFSFLFLRMSVCRFQIRFGFQCGTAPFRLVFLRSERTEMVMWPLSSSACTRASVDFRPSWYGQRGCFYLRLINVLPGPFLNLSSIPASHLRAFFYKGHFFSLAISAFFRVLRQVLLASYNTRTWTLFPARLCASFCKLSL